MQRKRKYDDALETIIPSEKLPSKPDVGTCIIISQIPIEIILLFCDFLRLSDAIKFSLTCRDFYNQLYQTLVKRLCNNLWYGGDMRWKVGFAISDDNQMGNELLWSAKTKTYSQIYIHVPNKTKIAEGYCHYSGRAITKPFPCSYCNSFARMNDGDPGPKILRTVSLVDEERGLEYILGCSSTKDIVKKFSNLFLEYEIWRREEQTVIINVPNTTNAYTFPILMLYGLRITNILCYFLDYFPSWMHRRWIINYLSHYKIENWELLLLSMQFMDLSLYLSKHGERLQRLYTIIEDILRDLRLLDSK